MGCDIISRVNMVAGSVCRIDREAQRVELAAGGLVPYDFLVLTPELQYATNQCATHDPDSVSPPQVFAVNSASEADEFLQWLSSVFAPACGQLLVYSGNNADTLCAVAAILTAGVPASRLVLASAAETLDFGLGDAVNQAAQAALQAAGVTCHVGVKLTGWRKSDSGELQAAEVNGAVLECMAALMVSEKDVGQNIFEVRCHG